MSTRFASMVRAGLWAGAIAAAALGLVSTAPWRPAAAQSVLAVPPCQCSAATAVAGIATQIVHCQCGAMSCALTEHTQGNQRHLLQCTR